MEKRLLYAGLAVTPWWIITLSIFAALEPDYSHFYKAVSELGAFGAANPLAMNVLCFFITGMLVVLAGVAFRNILDLYQLSTSAGWWVIILGVMLAGAAVPADMQLYFQSPWTIVHAVFVMFAVIPFLVASWKTHYALKNLGIGSKVISYWPLLMVPTFLLHGFLTQGGLVQRLTILIVLFWVSYLCWCLLAVLDRSSKSMQLAPAAD